MKHLTKITALLFLTIMVFFTASTFLPGILTAPNHDMTHDGCFGLDCSPVQHMFHVYSLPNKLIFSMVSVYIAVALVADNISDYRTLLPDGPPPKSSLV